MSQLDNTAGNCNGNNLSGEICKNILCQYTRGSPPSDSSERIYLPEKPSVKFATAPSTNMFPFSALAVVEVIQTNQTQVSQDLPLTGILIGPSQLLVQLDQPNIEIRDLRVTIGEKEVTVVDIFRSQYLALNRFCVLQLGQAVGFTRGFVGLLATKRSFNSRYFFNFDSLFNEGDDTPKKRGVIVAGSTRNSIRFLHSNVSDVIGGVVLHVSFDKEAEKNDDLSHIRWPILVSDPEAGFAVIGFSQNCSSRGLKGMVINSEQFNQLCLFAQGYQAPDILRIPCCAQASEGQNKMEIKQIKAHRTSIFSMCRVNYRLIATTDGEKSLKIWQTDIKKLYYDIQLSSNCSVVLADGKYIFACVEDNVEVWDWQQRVQLQVWNSTGNIAHLIKASRRCYISADNEGQFQVWRGDERVLSFNSKGGNKQISCMVAGLKEEKQFCAGYSSGLVCIYDYQSGEIINKLDGAGIPVLSMCLCKNGTQLVCGYSDGSLIFRNAVEEYKMVKKIKLDNKIVRVEMLNERELLICHNNQVAILNIFTEQTLQLNSITQPHSAVISAASVIDQEQFVTADKDGYLRFSRVDRLFDEIYQSLTEDDLTQLSQAILNDTVSQINITQLAASILPAQRVSNLQNNRQQNSNELPVQSAVLKEKDARIKQLTTEANILQAKLASQAQELQRKANYTAQLEFQLKNFHQGKRMDDSDVPRMLTVNLSYGQPDNKQYESQVQNINKNESILQQQQSEKYQQQQQIQSELQQRQSEQLQQQQAQVFQQQQQLISSLTREKEQLVKQIMKINSGLNRSEEEKERLRVKLLQSEEQCEVLKKQINLNQQQLLTDHKKEKDELLEQINQLNSQLQQTNSSLNKNAGQSQREQQQNPVNIASASPLNSNLEQKTLLSQQPQQILSNSFIAPTDTIPYKDSIVNINITSASPAGARQQTTNTSQGYQYRSPSPMLNKSAAQQQPNIVSPQQQSGLVKTNVSNYSSSPYRKIIHNTSLLQADTKPDNQINQTPQRNQDKAANNNNNNQERMSPSRSSAQELRGYKNEIQKVQDQINSLRSAKDNRDPQDRQKDVSNGLQTVTKTANFGNYLDPNAFTPQNDRNNLSYQGENTQQRNPQQSNIQILLSQKFQELTSELAKRNQRFNQSKVSAPEERKIDQASFVQSRFESPQRREIPVEVTRQNGSLVFTSPLPEYRGSPLRLQKCNIDIKMSPQRGEEAVYISETLDNNDFQISIDLKDPRQNQRV